MRIGRALRSPVARRIYIGLVVLLVVFLWANMVRRAMRGHGSQFGDFIQFSRDLVYDRIDVYLEYDFGRGSAGKYPPYFGFLFAPLVPLPTAIAASFWFVLNLGLAAAAAYLSVLTVAEPSREGRLRPSTFVIPLVLAAVIIGTNLETAQVNIVMLFFLCLALFAIKRGAGITAGVLLALITAFKMTPGLFIVYFAYKRGFKVVLGALIGLLAFWLAVPFAVFGQDHFVAIMRGWSGAVYTYFDQGLSAEGVAGFGRANQSLSAVLHRFLARAPAGAADRIAGGISVAIVLLLAWLCRAPARDRSSIRLSLEYSLLIIAALVIAPISRVDEYVVLLFPYVVGVYYLATRPRSSLEWKVVLYSLTLSSVLVSSSALRLMQALSLPFFGALALFMGIAFVLWRESLGKAPAAAAIEPVLGEPEAGPAAVSV